MEKMEKRIFQYFSNELVPEEFTELLNDVEKDDLLRKEFVRLQNTIALSHLSRISVNRDEGSKGYDLFKKRLYIKKQRETIRTILHYAAIALLLIIPTFLLTKNLLFQSEETNSLYVPAGQRAQLLLSDGTTVWLNAQSTLTYPARFSGNKREVMIEGEAYFDVSKSNKSPFVVHTQDVCIQVFGTEFNVYSYPETGYIQTDLINGEVRVYRENFTTQGITLKPNERLTVTPGKMLLSAIKNTNYYLWKEGIYAFDNEKLIDIINKLQLYYDVKIIVEDPDIFEVRYTGKFRQRDGIDEILRIIQKIQKFNIEKDIEKNLITLSR